VATGFIDAELAKGTYQHAIDDARRAHKPVPPRFQEARGPRAPREPIEMKEDQLGDTNLPSGLLEDGEEVRIRAKAGDGTLLVTDRRLAVWLAGDEFEFDIPFDALRRIQFDIERSVRRRW